MNRLAGILMILATGVVFYRFVDLRSLFSTFPVVVPTMSVVTAAVFVRLNRGMPSLDWKAIVPAKRPNLTSAILDITREYAGLAALNAVVLLTIFALSIIGLAKLQALSSPEVLKAISSAVGGLLAFAANRMAYLVWRDVDIVRLQKKLIDEAAEAEAAQADLKIAEDKANAMASAGLRSVPRLVARNLDDTGTLVK